MHFRHFSAKIQPKDRNTYSSLVLGSAKYHSIGGARAPCPSWLRPYCKITAFMSGFRRLILLYSEFIGIDDNLSC